MFTLYRANRSLEVSLLLSSPSVCLCFVNSHCTPHDGGGGVGGEVTLQVVLINTGTFRLLFFCLLLTFLKWSLEEEKE